MSWSRPSRARRSRSEATPRRLHYLSVPPSAAPGVIEELGSARLNERARVILEKPFGVDLESARRLNATVHSVFDESQVFRIDHFLGKEAVQNILALRFANGLFEPIWNRDHVDHVQIDVPETLSIGTRAGFYEQTGAFRDMVVTHLFQVLGFVAMEPPVSIHPGPLVTEKQKVFDSMEPIDPNAVVRGQYRGYRETEGVPPDSDNDTFVALQVAVDNWRWAGVPFFLRTGKCLAQSRQVVTLGFKEPPRRMFELDDDVLDPNLLTLDIGDPGAISATFLAKQPGPTMLLDTARMEFAYDRSFGTEMQLEPYERLLHDAMIGDRTLFTTHGAGSSACGRSPSPAEGPAAGAALRAGHLGPARGRRAGCTPPLARLRTRLRTAKMRERVAILFDIDGTLIDSGGAGAESWRVAFEELYGVPADIGEYTDAGMTDPEVGRLTFEKVIGREPTPRELARLLGAAQRAPAEGGRRVEGLPRAARREELLPRLCDEGYLLGLTTGRRRDRGAHQARARASQPVLPLRRLRLRLDGPRGAHAQGDRARGDDPRPRRSTRDEVLWSATPRTTSRPRMPPARSRSGSRPATTRRNELAEAGADFVLATLEEPLPL